MHVREWCQVYVSHKSAVQPCAVTIPQLQVGLNVFHLQLLVYSGFIIMREYFVAMPLITPLRAVVSASMNDLFCFHPTQILPGGIPNQY